MNIKKAFCFALLACTLLVACNEKSEKNVTLQNLTQHVDPYIGTGDHGHVFVGANVPFGLVQLGPTNITEGWDWTSGYHYSDSTIWGFSHMHLSGTGIGDLCDIAFMPVVGKPTLGKGDIKDPNSGMYSLFNRATEKVKAGYCKTSS